MTSIAARKTTRTTNGASSPLQRDHPVVSGHPAETACRPPVRTRTKRGHARTKTPTFLVILADHDASDHSVHTVPFITAAPSRAVAQAWLDERLQDKKWLCRVMLGEKYDPKVHAEGGLQMFQDEINRPTSLILEVQGLQDIGRVNLRPSRG